MNTMKKTLITTAILSTSGWVMASESRVYITESGIKVTPLFEAKFENNDNLGRYSSAEQPESSNALIVTPGIVLESDRNGNQYQVAYQLSSGHYFDSDDDDYLDHVFATTNFVQVSPRSGIGLNYSYLRMHEARGTGLLAGDELSTIAKEPVKYALHNVNATHVYGAENAKGRIESNLRYEHKTYKNYRNLTMPGYAALSTKYKDFDEIAGGVAFYYDVLPATDLIFEIDLADRRYKLAAPTTGESQDNLNIYYLVGSEWDITGKTSGKVRLGMQNKQYKSRARTDFNGFSWDLDLTWQPLNHSKIEVSAAQRAEDPQQGTNYIKETRFDTAWQHYWLTNFYSNVSFSFIKDDYSESSRKDELLESSFAFGYQLRDYAEITTGWRNENNDSSIATNSYKQNVWYIATNLIF
ncbi:outer membrane beta-barrel protein [Vibrio alfacsensis]|uniref:outer membrane beta-barrel protein n=1 Tax=Vibrio alfacsensis TaxID=1074311 RepID=UPI00406917DE